MRIQGSGLAVGSGRNTTPCDDEERQQNIWGNFHIIIILRYDIEIKCVIVITFEAAH